MRKISFILSMAVLSLVTFSCQCEKHIFSKMVREDDMAVIESYVSDSINYDSFLIMPTKVLFNFKDGPLGFLVGPLYENLKMDINNFNPIYFMTIQDKDVYLNSDISDMMDKDGEPAVKYCPQDSVVFCLDCEDISYTKQAIVNYLKRARLFYRDNGKLYINNRPDTFFLPRIKEDKLIDE